MKLAYKKLGQGQPLIILHGLFGSADNWQTLGKKFAENFEVYLVDQRNHGHSPHSDEWNYKVMSDDIYELTRENNLKDVIILGHSMGGKTAMQFVANHPELTDKLIVADIAPKHYPPHQNDVIEALYSVELDNITSRKEAEEQLGKKINDFGTKQFLLKNLYWKDDNKLAWRFNLDVIANNIEKVGETFEVESKTINVPTLFLRGEKAKYILDEDIPQIKKIFPNAEVKTIANAGHWIHAEQPKAFYNAVMEFINN